MKKSTTIVFCMLLAIALLALSCGSPQPTETEAVAPENPLVGVWEIQEVTINREGQEPDVDRDHLPGILIFTAKYFSWVDFHGDSLPELPENATDEQVAAVFSQLQAWTGTYEVSGTSVSSPVIVSMNPNDMKDGEVLKFDYSFEGDMLVLNFDFEPDANAVFKLNRLE